MVGRHKDDAALLSDNAIQGVEQAVKADLVDGLAVDLEEGWGAAVSAHVWHVSGAQMAVPNETLTTDGLVLCAGDGRADAVVGGLEAIGRLVAVLLLLPLAVAAAAVARRAGRAAATAVAPRLLLL